MVGSEAQESHIVEDNDRGLKCTEMTTVRKSKGYGLEDRLGALAWSLLHV